MSKKDGFRACLQFVPSVLPAVLLAFTVMIGCPTRAYADMGSMAPILSVTKLKGTVVLYNAPSDYFSERNYKGADNQVKNLKSSNKKVVVAKTSGQYTWLTPKKAGTSNVTFSYKGKKFKAKVIVKRYTNPIKNIKIGSKIYSGQFESKGMVEMAVKKVKGKAIKVTAQKDWKLYSMRVTYVSGENFYDKKIKNNAKLPNTNEIFGVYFIMKNTKTGGYEEICYHVV